MTENQISDEREAELRVKLVKRLAIAGVMVAVLLAVLAFFDYLAKPEEPDAPVFTRPVPVAPKKEVTQPVKSNPELLDPPKNEAKPAEPEPPPAVPDTPAKPEPAAVPGVSSATIPPVAKPAVRLPAAHPANSEKVPDASAKAEAPIKVTPARSLPESTAAPGSKRVEPETVAKPVEPSAATPSAVVRQPAALIAPAPPLTRLFSGFVVQAGVFSSASAAEELHAKLALNGIPSTLEAKVSVGPFKSREEALAAQEKMKALGIEGLLIPPSSRK